MHRHSLQLLVLFLAVSIVAPTASAQPLIPQPQASPAATVTQTIGIAKVTVDFHRPGVKGRPVWGAMVPYGEVWRAGANENTTISFSNEVTVEGKTLAAGTYGLHMIPTASTWTVIFSANATSWGSYYYKPEEDALRVTVTPQPAEMCEWLTYEFGEFTDNSATLSLRWEKLRVPVKLTFNTNAIVLNHIRTQHLRGMASFGWQGYNQAAQFCLKNSFELEQALAWADRSIALQENFANLQTKAAILTKQGKTQDAKTIEARSMRLATEADINMLAYQMMNAGKLKEAIELFQKNAKDYPNSWNVFDSLAEGLEKQGDIKGAITNYEKALKIVADDQNKKRITDTLTRLRAK